MRVEELERELRVERMEPDPEFARRLDEWAAAGFPRQRKPGVAEQRQPGMLERLRRRFEAVPPRRLLLQAGAVATAVIVVGATIGQLNSGTDTLEPASTNSATGGGQSGGPALTAPEAGGDSRQAASGAAAAAPAAPSAQGSFDSVGGAGSVGAANEATAPATAPEHVGVNGRRIAQSVDLSLSTAPEDFRDASDGVFDVVADHHGFVVSSNVSGGDPDVKGSQPGSASFRLKIPASQLPGAMAALSDLGHVVSRTDGTEDITGRFVGAKQRIAALTKVRQNLLAQLEDATDTAAQQSIRARLRIVQAQLEDAQGDLAAAQERVALVPVSVTIAADAAAGKGEDKNDSGWSLSDALHDAGDVLTVMAGIALVTLAVMVPLSLVGLLVWWVVVRLQRQRREAVLDQ